MAQQACTDGKAHGPHEWYWKNILRRDCPGLDVEFCGWPNTHAPHWWGERRDAFCYGAGLAGRCEHGVGMLDECQSCPTIEENA